MELTDSVKEKLSEAVELWAADNLNGKPALLATCMFFALEKTMKELAKEINKTFK